MIIEKGHDVDIFLPDAQLLPFLDPKLHDFEFEIKPSKRHGAPEAGFRQCNHCGTGNQRFVQADCKYCTLENDGPIKINLSAN
ncbi:hypothetical protein Nham_4318 (plasmid) [Nitrobacter hamburgensis X14]|uniref:Uncharacterized protein n=1 Tax=Nitrobacter hamburgensis (strain DSM 10229 / NCIMB 13809 / X14) TaxID=323097 RepID=Q1QFT1_NITHX|nr:hypothetical protein Nham_4318 [Nitrobacter hamburgensis X14]